MKTKNILFEVMALISFVAFSSFMPSHSGDFQKFFKRSPETRANLVTMVMKNKLSLDETQVEKAWQINLRYARMNQPYLENEDDIPENIGELTTLNQKRRDELKAILNPEQVEQAEVIRKQWINRLEILLTNLKENNFTNH